MAGNEALIPSFSLILVKNPSNIRTVSPPDAMSKIGLKNKPTNNPNAPNISKRIINNPRCSKLNRSNSFFIWGETKYETAYAMKDRLENRAHETNKYFIV